MLPLPLPPATIIGLTTGLALLTATVSLMLKRGFASGSTAGVPRDEDLPVHSHYCAGCDQGWLHPGQECVRPWASLCAQCEAAAVVFQSPGSPTKSGVG